MITIAELLSDRTTLLTQLVLVTLPCHYLGERAVADR